MELAFDTLSLSEVSCRPVSPEKSEEKESDLFAVSCYDLPNVSTFTRDNFNKLQSDRDINDVTFIIGAEKKVFYGLRALFAIHSTVFRNLLFGPMMEAQLDNPVIITDMTPKAFCFLRDFCYGLNPQLNTDIVCYVLYSCKKYLITRLEEACWFYIHNKVTDFNERLRIMLQLARCGVTDGLQQLIAQFPDRIFSTKNEVFQCLSSQALKLLLRHPKLTFKEERIWLKCLQWARSQLANEKCIDLCLDYDCKSDISLDDIDKPLNKIELNRRWLRQKMNDFLPLIRFAEMDCKFLISNVMDSGILVDSELLSVLAYQINRQQTCFCHTISRQYGTNANIRLSNFDRNSEPFSIDNIDIRSNPMSEYSCEIKANPKCSDKNVHWYLFASGIGFDTGVHHFTIDCISVPSEICAAWVLTTNISQCELRSDQSCVKNAEIGALYFYDMVGRVAERILGQTKYDMDNVDSCHNGDKVTVVLNCDQWTVTVLKNGEYLWNQHSLVPNKKYFPAFSVYYDGTQKQHHYRLLSSAP